MTVDPEAFFRSARSIRLHPAEQSNIRKNLHDAVRNTGDARPSIIMSHESFLSSAKGIALRVHEKVLIREAIMSNIAKKEWRFHPFIRLFSGTMAAMLIFAVCGAGMSYAAESALPGDTLYTIKVSFTEPLLMQFNRSTEAKARAAARLVSRRLEEAERLAEKSILTPEYAAIVEEHLVLHVGALETDLQKLALLDKKRSGFIAIDTAAEMEAHENLLLRLGTENNPHELETLLRETRRARRIAQQITDTAELHNVAAIKAQKASKEIQKTKATKQWRQRERDDAEITATIRRAEADLQASQEVAADADVQAEKATSALNAAKEVQFMLRLPARTKMKILAPEREHNAPDSTERTDNDDAPASASTATSADVESSLTTTASVSSSTSSASSASSVSSSVPADNNIIKTDELLEKALPLQ